MVDTNPFDGRYKKPNYGKYGSTRPGDYRDSPSGYKKDEETILPHIRDEKPEYEPQNVKEKVLISSRLMPSSENVKIKSLKLVSEQVIGNIFDRVNFLEKRILELRSSIALRKQIHSNIVTEIQHDVDDRNQFMQVVSDINEKRNIKLDISVLRKERRNEEVQFWRDLVELETELRTMEEEFEVESKIAGIFGENKSLTGAEKL
jgi:hypothetical protein